MNGIPYSQLCNDSFLSCFLQLFFKSWTCLLRWRVVFPFFLPPAPQYKQCCVNQWLSITLLKWNWKVQLWVAGNCARCCFGICSQTRMLRCGNCIILYGAASFVWVCSLYLQMYFERTFLHARIEVIACCSGTAALKTWGVTSSRLRKLGWFLQMSVLRLLEGRFSLFDLKTKGPNEYCYKRPLW